MALFGLDDTDVQILGIIITSVTVPTVFVGAFLIKVARSLDVIKNELQHHGLYITSHDEDVEDDKKNLNKCLTEIAVMKSKLDYLEAVIDMRKMNRKRIGAIEDKEHE